MIELTEYNVAVSTERLGSSQQTELSVSNSTQ